MKPFAFSHIVATCLGICLSLTVSTLQLLGAEPITVMTYNIRYNTPSDKEDAWTHRADKVAETIATVDTVGLQEARKEQIDDLVERLPTFGWIGAGRDDGKEGGEFVPIFYRVDRLIPKEHAHFWLSETPDIPGSKSWDTAITRMVTWVLFEDKKTGKQFVHMNTHFDHMGEQARLESAKLIRRKAAAIHPDLPLVLTGDFNCKPTDAPFAEMISAATAQSVEFASALQDYHPGSGEPTGTWNAFKEIADYQIDYVFTARGTSSKDAKILDPRTATGRFASDHLPIRAIIELP